MTEAHFLTIIHLSDLHFGATLRNTPTRFHKAASRIPFWQASFGHDFEIAQALSVRVKQVLSDRRKRHIPVLVVHTGDLTAAGRNNEFAVGAKFLASAHRVPDTGSRIGLELHPSELLDVPGNHDLRLLTNHRYIGRFPCRLERKFPNGTVTLFGINSNCAPAAHKVLANGQVDQSQLDRVCEMLEASPRPSLRVVALHHPLSDPPHPVFPPLRLRNRDEVSQRLRQSGADLVLAGHLHQPFHTPVGRSRPLHHVTGTGSQMLSETPCCFHVIDILAGDGRFQFVSTHYQHTRLENSSFQRVARHPI